MTARKPTRAKALGVSDDQYERLLAAQGGHCALCPSTPKTRRLHVDHDHATGLVRGLTCHRCNRFLLHTWVTADIFRAAALFIHAHCVAAENVYGVPAWRAVLDEINATGQDEAL